MNEQPVSQIPIKGDWGCFPNKQICEDCTEGKIEKMSEPVQVYTACQFVSGVFRKASHLVLTRDLSSYYLRECRY